MARYQCVSTRKPAKDSFESSKTRMLIRRFPRGRAVSESANIHEGHKDERPETLHQGQRRLRSWSPPSPRTAHDLPKAAK